MVDHARKLSIAYPMVRFGSEGARSTAELCVVLWTFLPITGGISCDDVFLRGHDRFHKRAYRHKLRINRTWHRHCIQTRELASVPRLPQDTPLCRAPRQ